MIKPLAVTILALWISVPEFSKPVYVWCLWCPPDSTICAPCLVHPDELFDPGKGCLLPNGIEAYASDGLLCPPEADAAWVGCKAQGLDSRTLKWINVYRPSCIIQEINGGQK